MITTPSAEISIKNLRIENNSEDALGATGNATAFSSCVNASSNVITVDDCQIYASRDTIYTGKSNCTDQWTYNNCDIYGFQDVICGGGNVVLNNCNWILNMDSDARLLVPQCRTDANVTTMIANDLTIKTADKFVKKDEATFTKAAYLGRAWGNGKALASSSQCIVNDYTDETGAVPLTVDTTDEYSGISYVEWF